MRVSVALALCCLCTLSFAADPAHASIRKATDIPAEELGSALQALAKDYDFQVLYRTEIVKDLRTQGAVGTLTSDEALGKVLKDTGLSYKYLDANTVTVFSSSASGSAQSGQNASSATSDDASTSNGGGKKSSQYFRLAQVDQGKGSSDSSVGNQPLDSQEKSNSPSTGLTEIIVTAQKRSERLQDVPVPVTAISADTLTENNQLRLQDYYTSVPGLSLNSTGQGDAQLAIRGLTTGGNTNPTVAVLVDDVPVGSSSALTDNANFVPDVDPSDLARVEVLRGPQGTLYGAESLGGLVKYVTVDPSTDGVSGRIQADTNSIHNGDGLGYGVRAAVNMPITDTLAIRASGFTRKDPGYIDNPVLGINGINEDHVDGGHFSALWRPSATFSLKLGALLQDTTAGGNSVAMVQPGLGDLQQSFLRDTGPWSLHVRVYTANVTAKLGDIDFTSVSGYSVNKQIRTFDFSQYFMAPIAVYNSSETKKFTQEFRLSSTIGQTVDWLFGAFYTHEASPVDQQLLDITAGAPASVYNTNFPTTFVEYSAFADLTVHFTDRFDVQFGGRESHNHQTYNETDSGPLLPSIILGYSSPLVVPTVRTKDSSFTYLVTPQLKISPDLMIYARLASGYRPGGPNPDYILFGAASHYEADKTVNYELGVKGDVLDHKLSFDGSVYYIDWKDIQIGLTSPQGFAYFTNASSAKSQGVELSGHAKPLDGLTIAGWVAWNDAKLTGDLPISSGSAFGFSGDRLPYSSRFSGNLSIEQEIALGSKATGFVRGSASYVGDRESTFSISPAQPRVSLPSYVQPNILAGVRYASWTVNCFANNVTDKRGVMSRPAFGPGPTQFGYIYIQPRTIGLSVTKTF